MPSIRAYCQFCQCVTLHRLQHTHVGFPLTPAGDRNWPAQPALVQECLACAVVQVLALERARGEEGRE